MIPTHVKITKNKNRHTKNDGNSIVKIGKAWWRPKDFFHRSGLLSLSQQAPPSPKNFSII
jgi:hypothetical protein